MKLRECYIQISPNEVFEKTTSENYYTGRLPFSIEAIFNWRAGALIDYIRYHLRNYNLSSEYFNSIFIELSTNPSNRVEIMDKNISFEIFFDEKKYRSFHQSQLIEIQQYIVARMREGIIGLSKLREDIPKVELLKIIDDFEKANYEFKWIEKSKKPKVGNKKFNANLECSINMNRFLLELIVYDGEKIIYSKELAKEIPSSTFYLSEIRKYKFKKGHLIFKEDNIDFMDLLICSKS